jgi:hypothetical protein
MNAPPQSPLDVLRAQLESAAETFSSDEDTFADLLDRMVGDVERASEESLEILPVAHHSPSSALHTIRRLEARQPEVVYMEMCEDLRPLVADLDECTFPVAMQAFARESEAFPLEWAPLTLVAPLTDFSAECQAMAYAMQSDAELVFVDRSVDHVFQQLDDEGGGTPEPLEDSDDPGDDEEASRHGSALGLRIGGLEPSFEEFLQFLLRNARVRTWIEWWNQYVERAVRSADYETYRHTFFLVGSLLRRLGRSEAERRTDRWRERYMWTRIRQHLDARRLDPADAVFVCGAAHAASRVDTFGVEGADDFEIPERTSTHWQYGLVPSSFRAIEAQFGHPAGTVCLHEQTWSKTRRALGIEPYEFGDDGHEVSDVTESREHLAVDERLSRAAEEMGGLLSNPPELEEEDDEQLLDWCIDIVRRAQSNDYMASTADAISIFEHAKLLARMRNRSHPTPFDFRDAAVTCLEEERVPDRDNVADLCADILGGNRVGRVGYQSMPPLAQDVFDRLDPLPTEDLRKSRTIQRALLDFQEHPEYRDCSDLLWRLHYLLEGQDVLRPIMGQRELGHEPRQESWDILLGKRQQSLIELGYEGVTVEQVVEKRLTEKALSSKADALDALAATEESILYLESPRLTRELGERAVELLADEVDPDRAGGIFERVRNLVHFYRSEPGDFPEWLENFVTRGYSHYARLLPRAFDDADTSPDAIADVLAFVFTLESLALSLGADRSELRIAIQQSGTTDPSPDKIGLLWTAEWLLDLRSLGEIRAFFDRAFDNSMVLERVPDFLTGFVFAMRFTERIGRLVVELVNRAFAELPDAILMPWLPDLLEMLRPMQDELVPGLIREVESVFPDDLDALDDWEPNWLVERDIFESDAETTGDAEPETRLAPRERRAARLLADQRASTEAAARRLDIDIETWEDDHLQGTPPGFEGDECAWRARELLFEHRTTGGAAAEHVGETSGEWEWKLEEPTSDDGPELDRREQSIRALLEQRPGAIDAAAERLGLDVDWEPFESDDATEARVRELLEAHPTAWRAAAALASD